MPETEDHETHEDHKKRKTEPQTQDHHHHNDKRQRYDGNVGGYTEAVAQHYNARPEKSGEERTYSPIFQLKAFNNYIKSILIQRYARANDRILDLCFGKGGDLLKYKKARVGELVGVDIAKVSIEQAKQRYNQGSFRFLARFYVLDCFTNLLSESVDGWESGFNVASVQFGIHYAFEDEQKLRILMRNISDNLLPKHFFIGTVPDSKFILRKLKESNDLTFGNDLYQIRFEQKEELSTFGHKYWFQLEDAIDDCPEFVVDFDVLEKIAKEYQLELRMKKGFHQFYQENIDKELLRRMKVLEADGKFEKNQWEIAGIYQVFAFEKVEKVKEDSVKVKEGNEESDTKV